MQEKLVSDFLCKPLIKNGAPWCLIRPWDLHNNDQRIIKEIIFSDLCFIGNLQMCASKLNHQLCHGRLKILLNIDQQNMFYCTKIYLMLELGKCVIILYKSEKLGKVRKPLFTDRYGLTLFIFSLLRWHYIKLTYKWLTQTFIREKTLRKLWLARSLIFFLPV